MLTLLTSSTVLFAGFASAVAVTTALLLSTPSAVDRTSIWTVALPSRPTSPKEQVTVDSSHRASPLARGRRDELHPAMVKIDSSLGSLMPYAKFQTYDGAAKFDTNAPHMEVDELEIDVEWQIRPEIELTTAFAHMDAPTSAVRPTR